MVYIPFWICIFAGAAIDARERRFPNQLAGACAVAAFAGVWLDKGVNTALDHAGLAAIAYLALCLLSRSGVVFATLPALVWGTPRRSLPFVPSIPWVVSSRLRLRSWPLPPPVSSQNRAPCHCCRFWCRYLP